VRSLEEPVRKYLVEREVAREGDAGVRTDESDSGSGLDSEDEEIVFVGWNGSMRDGKGRGSQGVGGQWKKARREDRGTGTTQDEGMVFDGFGDEDGGAFRYVSSPALQLTHYAAACERSLKLSFLLLIYRRWITHSISDYYGLQSRSVLVGDPQRKVVYVGVKQMKTGHAPPVRADLPRPLWELC
jgi:hypothetical protein